MTEQIKHVSTSAAFPNPDPFSTSRGHGRDLLQTILATAFFRCWHLMIFFAAWSTFITVFNAHNNDTPAHKKRQLVIGSTLLTVIGTVLGFVISYRTTSSFERYNEGRRFWSQITMACRGFARVAWFHVPSTMPGDTANVDQAKARVILEKKTVINLLEAFAVSVKHYLRGEDGVHYLDLFHLVKFLPAYALPPGLPSRTDLNRNENMSEGEHGFHTDMPVPISAIRVGPVTPTSGQFAYGDKGEFLLPARLPPKYSVFDLFPFSLLVKALTKSGREVGGTKAARLRARRRGVTSHNIPLEISLYLASYVSALQSRKAIDAPTTNALLGYINSLVDALTGLERILTTPIPFSYSFHLWAVTTLYCLALPPQIWTVMKWWTIPATVAASFIFFGFLVAGEEIENPFGYDKNDLNMDHFTRNIIRQELRAITGLPAPDPSEWAFSPENDFVLAVNESENERTTPMDWVQRGAGAMQVALAFQSYPHHD